jgi:hypothetical protein
MPAEFFSEYDIDGIRSYGIQIDRLKNILPKISQANQITLSFLDSSIIISASKGWDMKFELKSLHEVPFDLPEPKSIEYQSKLIIDAEEFSKLAQTASAVSSDIRLEFENNVFSINSETDILSYSGRPSKIISSESHVSKIESYVIANYLGFLASLIKECETISISLGDQKPVKFELNHKDKASFCFYLIQGKVETIRMKSQPRQIPSLPELTVSRFPEFLMYLAGIPSGIEISELIVQGFETVNEDYKKIGKELNLIIINNDSKIILSNEGYNFINILKNNKKSAKEYLNNMAISKIGIYESIMKYVNNNALTPIELFNDIKNEYEKKGLTINEREFNSYLGLATWCEKIDNKLALYIICK